MNIQTVYIIDDDDAVRDSMGLLLEANGIVSQCYELADRFLQNYLGTERGCLILDIRMPGISGLELQQQLNVKGSVLPIIFMTGHGDVPMAVEAMREGAFNFLRKPINEIELLEQIDQALKKEATDWQALQQNLEVDQRLKKLTPREAEIFNLVANGMSNKQVADHLKISERTVEVHRAQVMKKLKVKTLAELVKIQISNH